MNELDFEAVAKRAREKAKQKAERMWPPDMLGMRRTCGEKAYIRYYRQMTGVGSGYERAK